MLSSKAGRSRASLQLAHAPFPSWLNAHPADLHTRDIICARSGAELANVFPNHRMQRNFLAPQAPRADGRSEHQLQRAAGQPARLDPSWSHLSWHCPRHVRHGAWRGRCFGSVCRDGWERVAAYAGERQPWSSCSSCSDTTTLKTPHRRTSSGFPPLF